MTDMNNDGEKDETFGPWLGGEIETPMGEVDDIFISGEALMKRHARKDGKLLCEKLRTIREMFADSFEIEYESKKCKHRGPCAGTCDQCDFEASRLMATAEKNGEDLSWNSDEIIVEKGFLSESNGETTILHTLMGMLAFDLDEDESSIPKAKKKTWYTPAEIMFIDRMRIGTDGEGITTLVGFHDCPLDCKYCLNAKCHDENTQRAVLTAKELYDLVKVDSLYFYMTRGGGITFGGGEPLLNPGFIADFKELAPKSWTIRVETSLAVPRKNVKKLLDVVDEWIVDIKDINNKVYTAYTGHSNVLMIQNLMLLYDRGASVKIRVPEIPDYNTADDIARSIEWLTGYFDKDRDIERFRYKVKSGKE